MQNPHPTRPNTASFGTGRGATAVIRVLGNPQPTRLRGRVRSDWMVR